MILFCELENTLLFRDVTKNNKINDKVYIDLNDDSNDNLGIIDINAFANLKKYTKNNELFLISTKTKKEFNNVYLNEHDIRYNKLILGFGYEIYINNKLDVDWVIYVMKLKDKNINYINLIDDTMKDFYTNKFENTSYGYRINKLMNISLSNLKDVFKEHKNIKLYEDEFYCYVVYDLFDMKEVISYLINRFKIESEVTCVCGSSDYMYESINSAGNTGIYNCLNLNEELYLPLFYNGVTVISDNTSSVGEFILDKVTEILVSSYLGN